MFGVSLHSHPAHRGWRALVLARVLALALPLAGALLMASHASPATAQHKIAPDRCLALANAHQLRPTPVTFRVAQLADNEVRLTFMGHATFLIESPKGIRVATDYSQHLPQPLTPDIVTMNIAHSSHHTTYVQEGVRHILHGWPEEGRPARLHDLTVDDMRVRNVPTNIRRWDEGGTVENGNSIFVFEVAGFCIAHLGHLHHTLTPQQLANVGQMDIVLVPVDGGYTLDLAGMVDVLKALSPRLIVPMHYFSEFGLSRFLTSIAGYGYEVERSEVPTLVVARDKMPAKAKILVLPGY